MNSKVWISLIRVQFNKLDWTRLSQCKDASSDNLSNVTTSSDTTPEGL